MAMDTLAERWRKLEPHVEVYGPDDAVARPAVLLFHGCGGMRDHIRAYARAASEAGYRAFAVDSFAHRGWTRNHALALVCTGLRLRGAERTGDVLSTIWGVSQRKDVLADQIVLAGWSHGSWTIMDLMTMHLARPGEAKVSDADASLLNGVKRLYLVYPYGGPGALSRFKPWVRSIPSHGVIAKKDHITRLNDAERIFRTAERAGVDLDMWRVDGTHAFDEDQTSYPMRYDPALAAESIGRFVNVLKTSVGAPKAQRRARKA